MHELISQISCISHSEDGGGEKVSRPDNNLRESKCSISSFMFSGRSLAPGEDHSGRDAGLQSVMCGGEMLWLSCLWSRMGVERSCTSTSSRNSSCLVSFL